MFSYISSIFSQNEYDIIIVGGGISGLFMAYKLADTDLSILLIESNTECGGRIKTIKKDTCILEAGAARFHSSHTKLLSLITELGLKKKIIPLPEGMDHILRSKHKDFPYYSKHNLDLTNLLNESLVKKKQFKKEELMNITYFQYLVNIFDFETASFIKDSFGYDSEFNHLNAFTAIQMFEHDFLSDDDYYILYGGLSQIINMLDSNLKSRSNVTILKNKHVTDIKGDTVLTNDEKEYTYKHLICSIPKSALQLLPYFKQTPLLDSVKEIPLLRIYATYPIKDLWFKNIKRTTTDNYIRQIIPIDYEKGLIMISYTDDLYANMWSQTSGNGETFLIEALHNEIEQLFSIRPPKPLFISQHYWKGGVHLWKPNYNVVDIYSKILQPDKEKNIFICGEAYSHKQGWIEGALSSCYDVLHTLNIPDLNIQINETTIQQIDTSDDDEGTSDDDEGISDDDEGTSDDDEGTSDDDEGTSDDDEGTSDDDEGTSDDDEGTSDDENKKTRTFTIDKVLQKKKWIILEIDGKKKIYDIKHWIQHHPGGKAILEGVKANKYYKDNNGDKPITLFKSIHNGNVKSYIEKHKEYIKEIGVLNK